MPTSLERVRQHLEQGLNAGRSQDASYAVPGLWLDPAGPPGRRSVDPYRFFLDRLAWIEAQPAPEPAAGADRGWSQRAAVYNLLVRAATGFDHDGDGQVSLDATPGGWMETGTFLKGIALLPYVKHLGFDAVHLLPITAIGRDGRKGALGSVYAVRDPYCLDPRLGEPALGLDVETEFAAFVEAAHRLGIRVVLEFVLRTAARDADWAAEHPEWFYWIHAPIPDREGAAQDEQAYGPPLFTPEELARIHEQVGRGDLNDLPPPHPAYRALFTPAPPAGSVRRVHGRWIGALANGAPVRIPGAFADWPPDDPQPPWTDVTYLRLYDHADYGYIAYNTVRMYDTRLARPEHAVEPLWECIAGILPHYQRRFGIDGALIDMGHALPPALKRRVIEAARRDEACFGLWDESFHVSQPLQDEGYDAAVGSYWWLAYRPQELLNTLRALAAHGTPLPFFAAPETHNTPRAAARPGGPAYARLLWALGCLLPAIPFCHAGLELDETLPVNTGLDFHPDELAACPAERLPLFGPAAYNWENEANSVDWVRRALAVRARFAGLITDPDPATLALVETDNPHACAVVRSREGCGVAAVLNLDWEGEQPFHLQLPTDRNRVPDLLGGESLALERGHVYATFPPARCAIVEL